jgi:tetratricopeptide (TPR) repeat protein
VLSYLGAIYRDLGAIKKAIEFLEEGVLIHKKNSSQSNVNVGWLLTYLGEAYIILGDYEKAKNTLEEALFIYEKSCLPNNINIGWVSLYLGIAYRHLNQIEKSKEFFNKASFIYRKYFEDNNINITWVYPYLGDIYRKLQADVSLLILKDEILSLFEKHYGEYHLRTALALKTFGEIYLIKNDIEQAEIFLTRSLKTFGIVNHPDRYLTLECLASLYEHKYKIARKRNETQLADAYKQHVFQYLNQAFVSIKNIFPQDSVHVKRLQDKLREVSKY